jgi:DNA-binding NarL/FixJ family response regulator
MRERRHVSARRRAVGFGMSASLSGLLRDVLAEVGIDLVPSMPQAELVLVHVEGLGGLRQLGAAAARHPQAALYAVLSFADDTLAQRALQQGARGCFALGRPLEELRRLLRAG